MTGWQYMILALGIIAGAVLCRWEMRRPNKARLAWRITACIVAIASLVLMEMGLKWPVNRASNLVAVIRTEGADPDSIRGFTHNRNDITAILTPEEWAGDKRIFDTVHVFGYGLKPGEKELLHSAVLRFHPASPQGIVSAGWQRRLRQGERLVVSGSYMNQKSGRVIITLEAFATTVDSVSFGNIPGKRSSFSVSFIPKNTGKAVYRLTAKQGSEIFDQNPIPVEIIPTEPLKLLILSSSPDFETRFLKDWLARKGYPVAAKILVSANKSERAAYNAAHLLPSDLSPARPDSFDIIVSDPLTLKELTPGNANAIRQAVSDHGAGLIVRTDTVTLTKNWYKSPFDLYAASAMDGEKKIQQVFLRQSPSVRALQADSAGRNIAGDALYGQGKLLLTTVNDSYRWWLSGRTQQYESYWSDLIEKAAERRNAAQSYYEAERFPFTGKRMQIAVYPGDNTGPEIFIDSNHLAPEQETWYDGKWNTFTWPRNAGWETGCQILPDRFVFQSQEWPAIQAARRIEENYIYSEEMHNDAVHASDNRVRVSWLWFFLPFIICCAFLWAEPKIFSE